MFAAMLRLHIGINTIINTATLPAVVQNINVGRGEENDSEGSRSRKYSRSNK